MTRLPTYTIWPGPDDPDVVVSFFGDSAANAEIETDKYAGDGWEVVQRIARVGGALTPTQEPSFRHVDPKVQRVCPKRIRRAAHAEKDLMLVANWVSSAIDEDIESRAQGAGSAHVGAGNTDDAALDPVVAASRVQRLLGREILDITHPLTRRGAPRKIDTLEATQLRDHGWSNEQLGQRYGVDPRSVANAIRRDAGRSLS